MTFAIEQNKAMENKWNSRINDNIHVRWGKIVMGWFLQVLLVYGGFRKL